ncbi:multidrug MFS transporter [Virgisporangium aliadipatigenens]|uniref:Multidrug MFS transporter n=1 Tax=Virgisporangium aliadipatigenens TaxID=741659 RepID=A0A8J3YVB1_9ACTN|nr:epoxide hydrolase family protein [Virgisporangium aliadipatigenens]GIJ50378.1 multidrug MFS transporter [Virgisporangium aliadipatigenens]
MDLPPPGRFQIRVPDEDLAELRARLAATRWPTDAADAGWRYGTGLADLQRLTALWHTHDWRATEARLARHEHIRVDCGSHVLHAMRVGAENPAGTILLLHGWPSSFLEMIDLAELLAFPRDGGAAYDAVAVSLPGYGLSDPPGIPGPSSYDTAVLLLRLLDGLNLEQVWVHGYDVAAGSAARMVLLAPERILGYHTTEPGIPSVARLAEELTEPERAYLAYGDEWEADEGGYLAILGTRPHTLAYGLTDSPAGLAAWLFEKWHNWTLAPGAEWDWDGPLTRTLLDTLTLYWVTGCVAGANRDFHGRDRNGVPFRTTDRVTCPVGVTLTTQLIEHAPRALAERLFTNIRTWAELGRCGHFVTAEAPQLIAARIRTFTGPL